MRTVDVGDLSFEVAEGGPEDGVPALLLHGFPAGVASWEALVPRLAAAGMRVVAPHQRGYSPGARPEGDQAYGIDHLIDDALGLLDALEMPRAHVVAHDWGAIVGWCLAARHPERVHSLTALSVPHPAALGWALAHDPDQQDGSSYVRLLRIRGKAEDVLLGEDARRLRNMFDAEVPRHLVEAHVGLLSDRAALTGALGWYRAVGQDSQPWHQAFAQHFSQVPHVAVPTTYIRGARDQALRRAAAERCAEHVTGDYRYVELAGVGHWVPEQASEVVAEAVRARLHQEVNR